MTHYFLFKIHYSLTLYMTGAIWLIQVIHYPLFQLVGKNSFVEYHKNHIQKTSLVIALPMLSEALSGLYLLKVSEVYRNNFTFLAAYTLLLIIWLTTFLISVPKHNILATGYNQAALSTLINTNWVRTLAWSFRTFILFSLFR